MYCRARRNGSGTDGAVPPARLPMARSQTVSSASSVAGSGPAG